MTDLQTADLGTLIKALDKALTDAKTAERLERTALLAAAVGINDEINRRAYL